MHSALTKVLSLLATMLVTGIILAPAAAAIATPAVQDLIDLRTIISAAAGTIGDANNPNKGWGFGSHGGNGQMGTADLVNNITTTVLGIKFQLDTNKTAWLLPDNTTNATTSGTPTLPLSSSISLPSTVPTISANATNITADLSASYTDYVSVIPDLSTSLTALGRAYHREMNLPVREAIAGLSQAMSTLQSGMLQDNLVSSQAVVRELRASKSLANAQVAWNRWLNLPGRAGSGDDGSNGASVLPGDGMGKRDVQSDDQDVQARWPPVTTGRYYTHEELWGQRKARRARLADVTAENARVHVPFIA